MTQQEVEKFAREDGRVRAHLDVIRRKELLELVLEKMDGVRELEGSRRERERARGGRDKRGEDGKKKGWGIF